MNRIAYDSDEGFFVDLAKPQTQPDTGETLYAELTTDDVIALVNDLSSKLNACLERLDVRPSDDGTTCDAIDRIGWERDGYLAYKEMFDAMSAANYHDEFTTYAKWLRGEMGDDGCREDQEILAACFTASMEINRLREENKALSYRLGKADDRIKALEATHDHHAERTRLAESRLDSALNLIRKAAEAIEVCEGVSIGYYIRQLGDAASSDQINALVVERQTPEPEPEYWKCEHCFADTPVGEFHMCRD